MNQSFARTWNFLRFAVPVWSCLCNAQTALLQSQAPGFEVVSIKPNRTGERPSVAASAGGLWRSTNETLKYLIEWAWNVQDYQIAGGPKWIDSTGFDIVAKPEHPYTPSQETIGYSRQLVQALLADRFKLIIRRTTKELPIYVLVVGKDGPRLLEREKPANPTDARVTGGRGLMVGQRIRMPLVVQSLASVLGRPVTDETGLTGYYDFRLEWTPDEAAQPPSDSENGGPSIFTALEEQLGLKVETRRGAVEVLVVDHVQSPSEN